MAAGAAVADDIARHDGRTVDPSRIVLTASTSEAYAFLFKLLADPATRSWSRRRATRSSICSPAFEGVQLVAYRSPTTASGTWTSTGSGGASARGRAPSSR